MISFAPYQSCFNAASARWTDWAESSHETCSQYGSWTAMMIRSLVGPVTGLGRSLFGSRERSMGGAAVLAEADLAASGLAAAVADGAEFLPAGAGDFAWLGETAGLGVAKPAM